MPLSKGTFSRNPPHTRAGQQPMNRQRGSTRTQILGTWAKRLQTGTQAGQDGSLMQICSVVQFRDSTGTCPAEERDADARHSPRASGRKTSGAAPVNEVPFKQDAGLQAYMICVQASTGVAEARIQSTGSFYCRYTYHFVCYRSRRCLAHSPVPSNKALASQAINGCKARVKWGQSKLETRCGGAHDSPAFSKARVATYRERVSAGARHAAESQTVAMVSARLVRKHGKRNARRRKEKKKEREKIITAGRAEEAR
ncbi:hypothetical protein M431DRAFT_484497 [Trichoderma harzianum CBS 226.95]|uniref:Uncharacterized protein n=1 Tax=Trichoderma harzianum CBS 226.95 TaxID=983964 RepID=A0A2T4A5Z5_TRIHA|nr:hypothetical protein M431DRAFT_484497 [Trichoderma harzianum CBS 226.95]PTB52474.1 hypothetical protein M431DRAFT_484497 [Trichoderma harzianum CBS 226.95]